MAGNCEIHQTGFTVTDSETGHELHVKFSDDIYCGFVLMPEQGQQLPLNPWKKGDNPFQDDQCFEGMQTGYAPNGYWWFSITPTVPFSEILRQVEALNGKPIAFARSPRERRQTLADIVPRVHQTGYIFVDVNNDLGEACDDIFKNSPEIIMAYGYARRVSVAAIYIQGLVQDDVYDHVLGNFKALQSQTDGSVEFQEKAFSDAIDFMKTYNPTFSKLIARKIVEIAQVYDFPEGVMDDSQLIGSVLETIYKEQSNG
jgi:hypothetical protein